MLCSVHRFFSEVRRVRITLLGHASVLVEMTGATCLMDLIFFDPFEAEWCFPARQRSGIGSISRRKAAVCRWAGLTPSADLVHRVAASALWGWIARRKSFFYVRAYSRRFATLYALERLGNVNS